MTYNLFLPVEFQFREFDSRLLIGISSLNISNYNVKVFIGERKELEKYHRKFSYKKKNKCILIHKGLTSDIDYFYRLFKSNTLFLVLDEEGGVYSKYILNGWPRAGINNKYWKYVTSVLFWGKEAKKFYTDKNKDIKNINNFISGNPRFDLPKLIKFNNKNTKIKVLINLNFSRLNNVVNFEDEIVFRKKRYKESKFRERLTHFYNYQLSIFNEVIDMISFLATNNQKIKFIVRPHLVEKKSTYLNLFSDFKNITVENNLSVSDHFDEIKCVIHTGCTTAIEAYFAKIPSIIFIPNKNYLSAIADTLKYISIKTNTKTQTNDKLKYLLKYPDSFFNKKKELKLKKIIHNTDLFSYEVIAKKLNFIIENYLSLKNRHYIFFNFFYYPTKIFNVIKKLSFTNFLIKKEKTIIPSEIKLRDDMKFPGIDTSNFEFKVNKFSKYIGVDKIKIKKISNKIFSIERFD